MRPRFSAQRWGVDKGVSLAWTVVRVGGVVEVVGDLEWLKWLESQDLAYDNPRPRVTLPVRSQLPPLARRAFHVKRDSGPGLTGAWQSGRLGKQSLLHPTSPHTVYCHLCIYYDMYIVVKFAPRPSAGGPYVSPWAPMLSVSTRYKGEPSTQLVHPASAFSAPHTP